MMQMFLIAAQVCVKPNVPGFIQGSGVPATRSKKKAVSKPLTSVLIFTRRVDPPNIFRCRFLSKSVNNLILITLQKQKSKIHNRFFVHGHVFQDWDPQTQYAFFQCTELNCIMPIIVHIGSHFLVEQNPDQCYSEMRKLINLFSLGFAGLAVLAMIANFLQVCVILFSLSLC
jgi:hypothetical protein